MHVPLPDKPLLRASDLSKALGVSIQTILRWGRDGTLPRPLRIGPKVIAWPRASIEAHIAKLTAPPNEKEVAA